MAAGGPSFMVVNIQTSIGRHGTALEVDEKGWTAHVSSGGPAERLVLVRVQSAEMTGVIIQSGTAGGLTRTSRHQFTTRRESSKQQEHEHAGVTVRD